MSQARPRPKAGKTYKNYKGDARRVLDVRYGHVEYEVTHLAGKKSKGLNTGRCLVKTFLDWVTR